jgi:predicted nucleic acid-binding protein
LILTDTGPLVALIDGDDSEHSACVVALSRLTRPLLTTWPCFTEAMYLLESAGGHPAQDELWSYVEDSLLEIHVSSPEERSRMRVLMRQYKDTPMDLADASLVAAAEKLGIRRIFTIDSDFHIYRINRRTTFEIVP